ncbi:MAG: hydrogenase formation protein HypD [Deltaproteobacteria bacterium]|jgi:hydrogenase expression/formation protein HypD|nr:hydrogenase formation protein HypD [Deltaproteobacteria bacterium]
MSKREAAKTKAPPGAESFADPALCRPLLARLEAELDRPLRFMEVCGTHTVSLFRSGLHSLLPAGVVHISGPGCPVCVTHDREIAACLDLAGRQGILIATFGDLLRVPGPDGGSLKEAMAAGAEVQVVYSPLDSLELARKRPDRSVVFLGAGFETTAPAVAASVLLARKAGLDNFSVLSLHKLVPPALQALLDEGADLDALLLPGHVSTILGLAPYRFLAERHKIPGVVGGFEPADILHSLLLMLEMLKAGLPDIRNQYRRAVPDQGNPRAREILFSVFEPADALWRGLENIPASGLALRPEYEDFDAWRRFSPAVAQTPARSGCRCGEVLKGRISPSACALFASACTPARPVGPCMVSTEGSCAAHFMYRDKP